MPESADQENDKGISDAHPFAAAAASQRDIEVIAEPGGQRNMPSAPEFGNIPGEIGESKITEQIYPEQAGRADSNIGIS